MKIIHIVKTLLTAASVLAFAGLRAYSHPTDADSVETIPVGARLEIHEGVALNLLPRSGAIYFVNGQIYTTLPLGVYARHGGDFCALHYKHAEDDRVLKDTVILGAYSGPVRFDLNNIYFNVISPPGLDFITCEVNRLRRAESITIGEFKKHLAGAFELKFPPAKEMRAGDPSMVSRTASREIPVQDILKKAKAMIRLLPNSGSQSADIEAR